VEDSKTKNEAKTMPSLASLTDRAAPKPPRKNSFAWLLAKADASETPVAALGLSASLQRLAKLCKVLADDAGDQPFTLGTSRAAEVGGAGSNYVLRGMAMATLTNAGLVARMTRGSPQSGCSTWRWIAVEPSQTRWIVEACRGDVRAVHAALST
jgi:hypothetical protein